MLITLTIISILLFLGIIQYQRWKPKFPKNINQLIQEVQQEPLVDIIENEIAFVDNQGIQIAYELIPSKEPDPETILLIMGHSQSMIGWPKYFLQPLSGAGYQLIRIDNRGVGLSDWIGNWSKDTAYNLEDMVGDAVAVLDQLNIEKAHVIGASMGGMIAQSMAIHHPQRVQSLISIMSSGNFNDKNLPGVPLDFYLKIIRAKLLYGLNRDKEENLLKLYLAVRHALRGDGPYDMDFKRVLQAILYEIRGRKSYNPKVEFQHTEAVKLSGSRYEGLTKMQIPTLIVHGKSDPLIKMDHAHKLESLIPNTKTLYKEGMGHDIPELYASEVLTGMINFMKDHPVVNSQQINKSF